MFRIFLAIVLSFGFLTPKTQHPVQTIVVLPTTSVVYICDNGKTVVYHVNKNCSALKRCTHEIKEASETDAIKKWQLRKCKVCG